MIAQNVEYNNRVKRAKISNHQKLKSQSSKHGISMEDIELGHQPCTEEKKDLRPKLTLEKPPKLPSEKKKERHITIEENKKTPNSKTHTKDTKDTKDVKIEIPQDVQQVKPLGSVGRPPKYALEKAISSVMKKGFNLQVVFD